MCRKQFWTVKRAKAQFQQSAICRAARIAADISDVPTLKASLQQEVMPVTKFVGPQPWWAALTPDEVHQGPEVTATPLSLGERLEGMQGSADSLKVLIWWSRRLLVLDGAAVSDELESIQIANLQGIKLKTWAQMHIWLGQRPGTSMDLPLREGTACTL